MKRETADETYSDEEAARRRDQVIKRMLNTPPQPRPTKPKDEKAEERPSARPGRVAFTALTAR